MVPKVVHSSSKTGGRDDWRTPREIFLRLDLQFEFNIDAAADWDNRLCDSYFGPGSAMGQDALVAEWGPGIHVDTDGNRRDAPNRVFLNPPYSQNAAFVRKARAEADAGNALVVLLLPARTDVAWFHDLVWDQYEHKPRPRTEVRFLRGRLKFSGSADSAPFPSMVVVFYPSVPWDFATWKKEFDAAIDARNETEATRLMNELRENDREDAPWDPEAVG